MTPLNCPTLRAHFLVQDSRLHLVYKLSYGQFSLPWNKGGPGVNFNDTVKWHGLENPLFGARFTTIAYKPSYS